MRRKIRLSELAKELKVTTDRVIEAARREGIDVSVPSNSISIEVADEIRRKLDPPEKVALRAFRNVQLEQIIKSAGKAIRYSHDDPETALLHARKAAEAICRDVYLNEYDKLPTDLTFSKLIEGLSKSASILPKKVMHSLRVIQIFGGVNAHENIDDCLDPALRFFYIIVSWYFEDYRNGSLPEQIKFALPGSRAQQALAADSQ